MNWKRGLLRLWSVFSLLWLIGAGLFFREDAHLFPRAITAYDGFKFYQIPIFPSTTEEDVVRQLEDAERKHQVAIKRNPFGSEGGEEFLSNSIIQAIALHNRDFWGHFKLATCVAFIPPTLALFAGLTATWVMAGFRPDRQWRSN